MTPKHPRINCSVLGCRSGSYRWAPGHSFICGKCWRLCPAWLHHRRTRVRRILRKRGELLGDDPQTRRAWRLLRRIWEQSVKLASETRAGL